MRGGKKQRQENTLGMRRRTTEYRSSGVFVWRASWRRRVATWRLADLFTPVVWLFFSNFCRKSQRWANSMGISKLRLERERQRQNSNGIFNGEDYTRKMFGFLKFHFLPPTYIHIHIHIHMLVTICYPIIMRSGLVWSGPVSIIARERRLLGMALCFPSSSSLSVCVCVCVWVGRFEAETESRVLVRV